NPRGQVKVLDFGLAKISRSEEQRWLSAPMSATETRSDHVAGTVQYMSPEQILRHKVDHRSDIFILGVTLYEMATGRLPFTGTTMAETMDRILHMQPEAILGFNKNVSEELERIIQRCLEKGLDRRYQSTRELLIDLQDSRHGRAPSNRPLPHPHVRSWKR